GGERGNQRAAVGPERVPPRAGRHHLVALAPVDPHGPRAGRRRRGGGRVRVPPRVGAARRQRLKPAASASGTTQRVSHRRAASPAEIKREGHQEDEASKVTATATPPPPPPPQQINP